MTTIFWKNNNGGPEELYPPQHKKDAGLDLAVSISVEVPPGERRNIPCGINVALPPNTCGLVIARSSTNKRGLFCFTGLIDEGYRGPLFILVKNMSSQPIKVERGQRLAQILVLPNIMPTLTVEQVDELPEGERGESGFGSTGGGISEGLPMEEDPEVYFKLRKEIVDEKLEKGSVREPLTEEGYKNQIRKTLEVYGKETKSLRDDIKLHLGISPNWETRTNSKVLVFIRDRQTTAREEISKFAGWWWNHDWRGQKGQAPTTVQIQELWPQAFGFVELDEDETLDIKKVME